MITFLPKKPLPEKWMKASVLGSLWAVVEIIFGSLLHNLKFPLAGSILSFFSVFLLVAFLQLWNEKGIIWRSGLICALMKSLSPSAIILGPMIGIVAEAIILEFMIRLPGNRLFLYALGGALAVFSALVHKAVSLLILYGLDFIVLLENLYHFASGQLRIEGFPPSRMLILISGIYLASGAMAGIMGYLSGKGYIQKNNPYPVHIEWSREVENGLFKHAVNQSHSVVLLLILFAALVFGMVIINRASLLYSVSFTLCFILFMIWRYHQNMRFLKKPSIWIQLLLIVLFSAIFYKGFSIEGIHRPEGWLVGLKMVFRALLILTAFSAISHELKNPVVKAILYNRGLRNFYQSLELAFSTLPGLIENFSSAKIKLTGIGKLVHLLLGSSQSLLENFIKVEENRPKIFILSGEVNEGKSKIARQTVSSLLAQGKFVKGFITTSHVDDEDKKLYYIEDISNRQCELLCSEKQLMGNQTTGRFFFSDRGLDFGNQIIGEAMNVSPDLIVIDEIGPLEIGNKGWAPQIECLIKACPVPQLWVVREKLVKPITKKWTVGNVYLFNIKTSTVDEITNCIMSELK